MKEANVRQPPQHLEAWEQNRWRLREHARVDDRMLREQARVDNEMGAGGILLVLGLFLAIPGAIMYFFGDEIAYAIFDMLYSIG